MADAYALAMVSLIYIFLFTNQEKVSCSRRCSSFTENGWLSVDPENRICFKYYNKTSTWWDAKRYCEQDGLFLARPDSESINKFIHKLRDQWTKLDFWIGGINQEDSGWKWTNGDKMDYTDFGPIAGPLRGIISFFRKTTSCIMYGQVYWLKESCDDLAPYLCQSGRNTTLIAEQPERWMPRTQFSDSSTQFCERKSESTRRPACFVFFEERLTWWNANKTCHEQNMTLVIIRDKVIDTLMRRASSYTISGFWIGAINKDDTGWKWGNGEDMLYTNFNNAIVSWGRLFKQTLCGVFRRDVAPLTGWGKYECDSFYPFVCELLRNSYATPPEKLEISEQTTSPARNSDATPPVKFEMNVPTTSAAGTQTARTKNREDPKQRIFKVKKAVGGRLNPKLVLAGLHKTSSLDLLTCCRLCSLESGCELVNYCERTQSCVLYGNFDFSVRGGVTSERGCSVYVAMD